MSVADISPLNTYVGNASTSTPYPISWRFDDDSWVTVDVVDSAGVLVTLAQGSDYVVNGNGLILTGEVVTSGGAIPATSEVRIYRNTPDSQTADFGYNSKFSSANATRALDKVTMLAQDRAREITALQSRTLRVPNGETIPELDDAAARAEKIQGYDASGDPLLWTPAEILSAADDDIAADVAAAESAALEAEISAGIAQAAASGLVPISNDMENTWWAHKALMNFNSALPALGTYLGVAGFGDSLAMRPTRYLIEELVSRVGLGAMVAFPLTDSLASSYALTRVLSSATDDVVTGYWPNNTFSNIASGGYVEYTVPASGPYRSGWRKITIPVGLRASGGSVDLTVVQNGVTTVTESTSGSGSVGGMVMFEVDESDGLLPGVDPVIRVTASGGSIYVGGVCLWRDRGVVPFKLARGQDTLASQNTVPTANLTLIKNTFAPALMVHHMFEEDLTGATTATHYTRMNTYFPETTHLVISGMPYDTGSGTAIDPEVVRGLASAAGFTFVDGFKMFRNYANLVALGWFGDGVHLAEAAYIFDLHCIYGVLPFLAPVVNNLTLSKRRAYAILADTYRQPMILTAALYKTTSNGAINDTGSTATPSARMAFSVDGTAAGYASGMAMSVASRATSIEHGGPFSIQSRIQGLTVNSGVNVWLQVGLSGATHNAPDKTVKSIGFEIERAVDHGYTGGLGNVAIRAFCYTGTTLVEGPWVATDAFTNTNSQNFYLHYEAGKLSILGCSDNTAAGPLRELTSIRATLGGTTLGGNVFMGIQTSGATSGSVSLVDANFFPTITADPEPWSL